MTQIAWQRNLKADVLVGQCDPLTRTISDMYCRSLAEPRLVLRWYRTSEIFVVLFTEALSWKKANTILLFVPHSNQLFRVHHNYRYQKA